MHVWRALIVLAVLVRLSAQTLPVRLTQLPYVLPPAVASDGRTIAFASNIAPDGSAVSDTADVYVYTRGLGTAGLRKLTSLTGLGATGVSLSSSGSQVAYTFVKSTGGPEEVHVVDVRSGADVAAAVDSDSCVRPLVACVNCIFACLGEPHVNDAGAKVLYAARRSNPFYVASTDRSSAVRLPVFSGALAPSSQRVISDSGVVVFTSAAPSGPTLVATPTDVYVISMDGTNLRAVTRFAGDATVAAGNAAISGDGGTIAFESNYQGSGLPAAATRSIWTVKTDGSGLRRISDGLTDASLPSLSLDGTTVAYLQNRRLHARRTDGTGVDTIVAAPPVSTADNPVLSGNGATVAYTLGPPEGGSAAVLGRDLDATTEFAVFAPAVIRPEGITGAAGFGLAPSPGSLISIYGANLTTSDSVFAAARLPLPRTLGGVSILLNGAALPLTAVSRWQVNAQLPPGLAAGSFQLQVQLDNSQKSNIVSATAKAISAGLFVTTAAGAGYTQSAAYHAGTAVLADMRSPATAGEVLEMYGTGFGPVNPVVLAGNPLRQHRSRQW